ncbi:DUF4947 domain-containing protein [Enterococcus pingfangensis]
MKKMQGLVCKYCGGNQFDKTEKGYECTYCHAVYELEPVAEKNKRPLNKMRVGLMALIAVPVLILSGSFLAGYAHIDELLTQNPLTEELSASSNSDYSTDQLSNPEQNVRIAELSLNQADLDQAAASVKEFGGKNTKKLEKRVKDAQAEHDSLKQKRLKVAPKADMLIENPDTEFGVVTYYREASLFLAYGPDFTQYSVSDILRIWGQPDKIITNAEQIKENMLLNQDEKGNPLNYEAKVLQNQWTQGQLTWREVRAFLAINQDSASGSYSKEFVYEKQGKPNVYFTAGHVGYVTPIVRYLSFTRLPEKYPHTGLGKYPEDFPKNYGSDGFYHEK